jgi:hypothetical protein
MVRGTARRLGLQRARPLAFTQTARPTESTDPCSPEWEPTAVFPVGVLGVLHSWRCACGAGPRFGGVFADPRNARSAFVAHVMRGIEVKT